MENFMYKYVTNFGEGLLELVNASHSFADSFRMEKLLECDLCGCTPQEIQEREEERVKEIKSTTWEGLEEIFDENNEYFREYPSNPLCFPADVPSHDDDFLDEKFLRRTWYATGGGLGISIAELHDNKGYLFEIYHPRGFFDDDSTLKAALSSVGYSVTLSYKFVKITGEDGVFFNAIEQQTLSQNDHAINIIIAQFKDSGYLAEVVSQDSVPPCIYDFHFSTDLITYYATKKPWKGGNRYYFPELGTYEQLI